MTELAPSSISQENWGSGVAPSGTSPAYTQLRGAGEGEGKLTWGVPGVSYSGRVSS